MRRDRLARAGLLLACVALVAWVRPLPLSLDALEARSTSAPQLEALRAERQYTAANGRDYVYLDDLDSYLWLRHARNVLRHGSTCESRAEGDCRDTVAHAPVGRHDRYAGSLHALAIAAVHRIAIAVDPGFPLPASSFLTALLVGVAAVLPAFALGVRLGGALGGVAAALLIGFNPFFLLRSGGSDNDVWNVALPLFAAWAAVGALGARTSTRRIALALLAGCVMGMHAATWRGWIFTYGVVAAGLALNLLLQALLIARRQTAAWRDSAAVLVAFYLAAGAAVSAAGEGASYWTLPFRLAGLGLGGGAPVAPLAPDAVWPDLLATVGELGRTDLGRIVELTTTPLLFIAGLAGLVVLALPRRRWRWGHLAILVAAVATGRQILTSDAGRLAAVLLAAAPAVVATGAAIIGRQDQTAAERGGCILVTVWFLGALFAAFSGTRFALLLVAPLGLAAGAGLGRLHQLTSDLGEAMLGERARAWIRPVLFCAFAALLVLPFQLGVAAARSRVPEMRDVWWDAFTHLAQTSSPDAIVHVWWDRGYWAEYVAERRTTADGASLLTHLPYWLARALLAGDEHESAGLLRMLDCGSDATPEPEGARGAHAKLVASGVDPALAPGLIIELAGLDRAAAERLLSERGFAAAARDDILAATHCEPPPAYVVVSNRMAETISWRKVGGWSFARAYAARAARLAPAEVERTLKQRFGLDADAASALAEEARGNQGPVQDFAAPTSSYLTPDWLPCSSDEEGGELGCAIPSNPRRLRRFVYKVAAPGESELVSRLPSGRESIGAPGVIVAAESTERRALEPDGATHPALGVLVDVPGRRILLGSNELIRSTFTALVFLDGRTLRYFDKVDERDALDGEKITTWRVRWPPS